MAKTSMKVALRQVRGKGGARTLRRQGLVPAVVYGKGMEPCAIAIEPKALSAALGTEAGMNALITLKGEGPFDGQVVILKDLDVDPIRREPIHADFYAIDMKKKAHFMVPVHTIGKAEGEKIGGSLQLIRHELEVVCLPTAVPKSIDIDVTALKIGGVVHIEDIELPKGVEVPHDVNFTIITVTGIKAEEEEVEAAEEGEGAEEEA